MFVPVMAGQHDFEGKTEQELADMIVSGGATASEVLDVLVSRDIDIYDLADYLVSILLRCNDDVVKNKAGNFLLSQKVENDILFEVLACCSDPGMKERAFDAILTRKPDLQDLVGLLTAIKDGHIDGNQQKDKVLHALRRKLRVKDDTGEKALMKEVARKWKMI